MRIGMVCPYSWGVPGGVQFHVRDLAEYFRGQGHEVSVLAPSEEGERLPPYFTSAGRPVPVRYNGSVARLTFGPATSTRVTQPNASKSSSSSADSAGSNPNRSATSPSSAIPLSRTAWSVSSSGDERCAVVAAMARV